MARNDEYRMRVELDYAERSLRVSQDITFTNRLQQKLAELLLIVETNRTPGVFSLAEVSIAGSNETPRYTLDGAQLEVALPALLNPGRALTMHLTYTLNLPDRRHQLGFTGRQLNFGDWYPFIPPYPSGTGWISHQPGKVGEHLVYPIADFDVKIVGDSLDELSIAASAPAQAEADGLRFHVKGSRNFAWSASDSYETTTTTVDNVVITSYWFPEHDRAGTKVLEVTRDALDIYNEHFGPFPHRSLAAVEADFPDGMEYDGLYFLGEEYYEAYSGSPAGYLTMLAAHETAHQWWYALVGSDQAIEPFLDEALATYSELLFYETYYTELLQWWWQYRIYRFNPSGCVTSTIYEHPGFRSYVNAVYLHGAELLHEVRSRLGDERFRDFLRSYVIANSGELATIDEFIQELNNAGLSNPELLFAEYCSSSDRR